MHNPLVINFKDIEHNDQIEQLIKEKYNKLKQICHGITKCHVFMERLSKNHHKGNVYRVELDLKQAHFPDIFLAEDAKEGELSLESAIRNIFKKTSKLAREQILRRKQKVQRLDKIGVLSDEALT